MIKRTFAILAVLCACLGSVQAQNKPKIFPQLGHSTSVASVAFSPNGKLLASGSWDNTVKLWDVASGRELRTLSAHSGWLTSVAFSPDGKLLASGSNDKTIKLWDVASGRELRTLSGHSNVVESVAFSPDGHMLASGSDDHTIKLWDVASGRALRTLSEHSRVESVVFSPDGKLLASGSNDKTVKLWDVASGGELRTLAAPQLGPVAVLSGVTSVAFSPDGKLLASGSYDKTVKLWDVASGRELRTLSGHSDWVYSVVFSPDGKLLASGSNDKTIKLWGVASGGELRTFSGHSNAVASVAFSPDGKYLASGSWDNTIKLWGVESGGELRSLSGHSNSVSSIAFSPDGKQLVSGSWDTTNPVKLWDVASGRELRPLGSGRRGASDWVSSVAFSSDGKLLASSGGGAIKLWDVASGGELRTLSVHSSSVTSVAFSPDGKLLASGDWDNTVRLWDVASGHELHTLSGHSESVTSVAFSPDGKQLASGSLDNTNPVKLWDVASGRELRSLNGRGVFSVAFSPDGKLLASGGYGNTVKLWDVTGGRVLRTLGGYSGSDWVTSVAFSPDGKLLASGSKNSTIKLWDVASGRELRTLSGHTNSVSSVAFSPDGKLLASGGDDGTTRTWSISSGKEKVLFIAFTDGSSLAVTPEGYFNSSSIRAEEYLNVRVGTRVFGIGDYREKFYRPDLVKLGLAGQSLEQFGSLGNVKIAPVVELIDLPPSTSEPKLTVNLRITDGGGGIGQVRVFLNGTSVVQEDNAPSSRSVAAPNTGPVTRSYTLPLANGPNELRAVAFAADDFMSASTATATVVASLPKAPGSTLHAVVVGINEFKDAKNNLKYSVADAQLFADTLIKYSASLYQKVDIKLLTTPAETTRDSIIKTLTDMQKVVGPNDLFVFYASSHGNIVGNEYYLVTSNVESLDRLKDEAVSRQDLTGLLANIPATRKLVVIDTCHAQALGGSLQAALLSQGMNAPTAATLLGREIGLTVLAAAATDQEAREGYNDHGLFTYIVTKGLTGKDGFLVKSAADNDGTVDTSGIEHYVEKEVPPLALNLYKHEQEPTADKSGKDFPITKVK